MHIVLSCTLFRVSKLRFIFSLLKHNAYFGIDVFVTLQIWKKYGVEKVSSKKQLEAQKRARAVNSDNARKKIENAINVLRIENKAINMNSVAVASGCSINTVRKYRDFIQKQSEI